MPHVKPPDDIPSTAPSDEGLPQISPDEAEQEQGGQIDNIVPSYGYQMAPLVGIGGSAGAIRPLQAFFEAIPADSQIAFVVVLHLSPDHISTMDLMIQRWTKMRVLQAENGVKVEPNTVYVIPPGKHLTATNGHLKLTELEREHGRRVAVDLFFRSLADTHGPHAAAIILSGADGDGALGIKRIKERGGLTIAQDPDEAEHNSMPLSAIHTGMVDWVLQAAQMPQRLVEYIEREKRLVLPPEEGPQPAAAIRAASEPEAAFREILVFLRTRTGRDFSYYKRATILRRISRRMQVNGVQDLLSYLVYLRTHPGEAGALLKDLLISVTNFFRDRDAFAALERRIPELFEGKSEGDLLRVWIPACATGEEAYSIAMLLVEHAAKLDIPPAIQVFGCDLDEDAIQVARAGIYPETITADLSDDRLRRFFVREHRGYRVRRELRELVLFAAHDLLKDAPFSRLDLVSCRNLLIYLNNDAQARAIDIFHFALNSKGLLFLGTSETVDEGSPLFDVVDKKARLYRRKTTPRTGLPVPGGPSTLLVRQIEAQVARGQNAGAAPPVVVPSVAFSAPASLATAPAAVSKEEERISAGDLHLKLLERFGPPSVMVDREYDIQHLSESSGRFLHFGGGEPTTHLLRLVHPALRLELRSALSRATHSGHPAAARAVAFEWEGQRRTVDMNVYPASDIAPDYLLVTFELEDASPEPQQNPPPAFHREPVALELERELEQMKSRWQDTVEQHEASTEELRASNEELQAMNEELRSATEELETSREELQSINEELTTVNQELKGKVEELAHANSDLQNLMGATAIATLFLDRNMNVMRFTQSAAPIFNLISTDLGRPLSDLQHRVNYPGMAADAQRVLANLIPVEREINGAPDRIYLARMLPYRTLDDRIGGVVLTCVDITEQKSIEAALARSEERLRLVLENAREFAIFSTDLERRVTSWNSGAEQILGYSEREIMGQFADVIFTEEDRAAGACEREAETALKAGRAVDERWHRRKDGSRFWGSGVMMPMRDSRNAHIGFVKIFRDETEAKRIEEALVQSRAELEKSLRETELARREAEAANRTKDHFLAALSHELRTPLTPVLMAAESLRRKKDLPPRVMAALDMICRNIELETHFIDDLLDISRISHGKLELVRKPLDLHEAIRRAVEVSQAEMSEKKQELSVELDAKESRVNGDFARLQQVFWNLLKNASKFTPEGGSIRISSRNDGPGSIAIEVSDTGRGINPAVLEDIFQAFRQEDTSITRKYGGLGLGLAIAKATVSGHNGRIVATSPGCDKGSTFTVRLPLDQTGVA